MRPGRIQAPETSIACAPRGALQSFPAHSILPSPTTTVACATGGAPVPSMRVAPVKTTGVDAGAAKRSPARASASIMGGTLHRRPAEPGVRLQALDPHRASARVQLQRGAALAEAAAEV